jgi:hypothetical protein
MGNAKWSILGDNPAKGNVHAALSTPELRVIAYKESRFRQFDNSGMPLFGKPNGFGLMQLDNPILPSPEQLWNWRLNIFGGISLYNQKKQEVTQHFKNIYAMHPDAPHLTTEMFKLALYQYYNGGWYWSWDKANRKWQKSGPTEYGDDSLGIEKSVAAGHFPPDWN